MMHLVFYSPILDLYFKHEKWIHDFLVQAIIYVVTYMVDAQAIYAFQYNHPLLSLVVLIICFFAARLTILALGKQALFGNFVNWSWQYCLFLAVFSWFTYLIFIRLPRFS